MENVSSLGTYVAYGLIVLFWVVIAFFVLRTVMFASLLLIQPVRNVFGWLRGGDLARGEHVSDVPAEPPQRPGDER